MPPGAADTAAPIPSAPDRVVAHDVADLVALVPTTGPSRRLLLGVAGAPGAGKTTVARMLVAALGPRAVHVPMDGFHLADRVLAEQGSLERKGAPDTFDAAGYQALLDRLRHRDATTYAPEFDRRLEQPVAGSIAVRPAHEVVVSEGNYLLLDDEAWAGVAARFDAVWFVEADDALRRERIVRRHERFGKSPGAARSWVLDVDEPNAVRVAATRLRADVLVDVTRLGDRSAAPPGPTSGRPDPG